jgi:2'-5' RNA ligase
MKGKKKKDQRSKNRKVKKVSKKKRVFIGIPISEQLQGDITQFNDEFLKGYPVRKIKPKNLHITLVPPWHIGNAQGVLDKFSSVTEKVKPFDIKFNEVSFGPNPKRPRLVWASGATPYEILQLKKYLEEVLNKQPEKRDFKLHLTIARFRYQDYKNFPDRNLRSKVNWTMKVESFCLYESKLLRSGAEYEVIRRLNLDF